jgi:hypothetical protein
MVRDEHAQVCMHYWAACELQVADIEDVIQLAIESGVAFTIGVKLEDIHHSGQQNSPLTRGSS